jgi:hypothetical protein
MQTILSAWKKIVLPNRREDNAKQKNTRCEPSQRVFILFLKHNYWTAFFFSEKDTARTAIFIFGLLLIL